METKNESDAPKPENRAVKKGMVKVRALAPIGEEIEGEVKRFVKGDEFELEAARAKVLPKDLIEVIGK
jgi:hypothetical protein